MNRTNEFPFTVRPRTLDIEPSANTPAATTNRVGSSRARGPASCQERLALAWWVVRWRKITHPRHRLVAAAVWRRFDL
jgi:hypothetical protein